MSQGEGPLEQRLRAVLDARCPRRATKGHGGEWGVGDDEIVGSAFRVGHDLAAEVHAARDLQRALFDAGLAWPRGPVEYGGAGLDDATAGRLVAVAREYELPDMNCLLVGHQIVAPAVLAFGTDTQRRRWLPALWRADVVGCQLFSEPEAGSDLASLRATAVRDGDVWRVNGQKVWSSGAHFSHVGELLARTDPDPSQRHRGLTMFLVDMDQPGVAVRPLRQMNGSDHFCEVFLDDVVVPDDRRIGAVGQGWAVAQTSLTSERDGFGDDQGHLFRQPLERLVALVRHRGLAHDPLVRNRVAEAYSRDLVARLLAERLRSAPDVLAGAGASLVKVLATETDWQLAQTAAAVLGPAVVADGGEWGHYAWSQMVLSVAAPRIAGGTNEIQRNIVAERALGLPREPKGGQP